MAKSEQKLAAFALRREGKSIKEIAGIVEVTKDTVSKWMREIVLTVEEKALVEDKMLEAGHKGRMMGATMNRNKKIQRIETAKQKAEEKIQELSTQDLFYVGLGLYWGEGTKSGGSGLAVTNSDPRVIKLMIRWFVECLEVQKADFMPRIFISDTHKDREEKILDFWSQELDIPILQFKKTIFLDKGKKVYENREVYYGVLALRVAKGTDTMYQIFAYIARVFEVHNCRGSSVG